LNPASSPAPGSYFHGFPANAFGGATALASAKKMQPAPGIIERDRAVQRRAKIWEMNPSLHCSIVGTCLTTADLRALVRKFMVLSKDNPTDHDYHGIAVSAAGKQDNLAKQIQKTLDRQHKAAIARFEAAESGADVLKVWTESVRNGDIPGAYWAALTHPKTDDAVVRKVFGEVHMLSHLVGAANRADIRRLHRLEEEKTELTEKLARQESQLRDGILARDEKIADLTRLLSVRIASNDAGHDKIQSDEGAGLESVIADLRKQLDGEIARRQRAETKVESLARTRTDDARRLRSLERDLAQVTHELEIADTHLAPEPARSTEDNDWSLDGAHILYIGGRPHQIPKLKAFVESVSGSLLHHDGGIDERDGLLAGLVSRADVAVFPVDCVSHAAMLNAKKLCRQLGKPFVPLRSSGVSSLLHGLRSWVGFAAVETATE
jgi:hypothetical protein